MINPSILEEAYKEFVKDLTKWAPDGVIDVNLFIMHDLDLLNSTQLEQASIDSFMQYFHVIETEDKVTLFNEQFAIWISPQMSDNRPTTLTLISLLHGNTPHLEIVFSTSGVYNTPKYILKILQHFLAEVEDTEATISSMDKK